MNLLHEENNRVLMILEHLIRLIDARMTQITNKYTMESEGESSQDVSEPEIDGAELIKKVMLVENITQRCSPIAIEQQFAMMQVNDERQLDKSEFHLLMNQFYKFLQDFQIQQISKVYPVTNVTRQWINHKLITILQNLSYDHPSDSFQQFSIYTLSKYKSFIRGIIVHLSKDDLKLSTNTLLIWQLMINHLDPLRFTLAAEEHLNQNEIPYDLNYKLQQITVLKNQLYQLVDWITTSNIINQLFKKFSRIMNFREDYTPDLFRIHSKVEFQYINQENLHGITLFTGQIVLNLLKLTQVTIAHCQHLLGYYLMILLNQAGHYMVKEECNDYEIDSTDAGTILESLIFINPNKVKKCNPNRQQMKNRIGFPYVNDKMAQFLINPLSWQLEFKSFKRVLWEKYSSNAPQNRIFTNMSSTQSRLYVQKVVKPGQI